MPRWTIEDIPNLSGRTAIVTGANSGLGLETAVALAQKGAHVIMACRDTSRGQSAVNTVLRRAPGASVELQPLNLANLDSIRRFAETCTAQHQTLDLLINNAGLMALPRQTTENGFEMQFGVNHLGHFALTAQLIERLIQTPHSRVVTVSSSGNWFGRLNFGDLMGEKRYSRYIAYTQSKLANVVFAVELQRRLERAHAPTLSNAAHPGLVMTNLQTRASDTSGSRLEALFYRYAGPWISHPVESGVLPQLYAATAPAAEGGKFYGPDFLHLRGYPRAVTPNKAALDEKTGRRLWEISEELTGVAFTIPTASGVSATVT